MSHWRLIWMAALATGGAAIAASMLVLIPRMGEQAPARRATAPAAKVIAPPPPKASARLLAPTTLSYYKVHVALDGTLRTDTHTFHLYAANVPSREFTCTYRNGQRWACGLRAYVALVNLVGTTAIECHPEIPGKPNRVICHQGNTDLSEWMLEHGWARLQPGVTERRYVEAAEAASAARAGMWTPAPPPPPQQGAGAQ